MMKMKIVLVLYALFLCSVLNAQKAIKLSKQQTTFFYTQLNLHGGYIEDVNGSRWDVTNRAPNNQVAFQFLRKNKKTQQKGYIETIRLASYSIRLSVLFDKGINSSGQNQADFKLKLLDTWLKFKTKWDRTTIWIGNKSIPYGHNPKLDPVSSFMTNLIKMDIGFVQDLGVFLKTPISKQYDMEMSLTSGGVLNKPILICDNLIDESASSVSPRFSLVDYSYDGTWMVTGRIGNQSFKKNEFGMNVVSGRIANNLVVNDFVTINRVGMDWVFKYREKIRIGNQLTFGHSNSGFEGSFGTINYQGNADLFLPSRIIISTSFACNYHDSLQSNLYHFNYTNANSITYALSPHTRIRLNQYYTKTQEANEDQWGVFLQFTTGIGKRN